jgi:hypothetical protein
MALASTTAKTKDEVNNMSRADRLWDSLSYSYGRKGDLLSKEYDKARSQADRQALSRGMQRSSYNNQVLANIDENRINALNDNQSALIADYENRLGDIEDKEWERDFQERQFAANREDAAWQQGFQEKQYADSRADTAWQQGFQEKQYSDSRNDTLWNQAFQEKQYDANRADTAWQQEFSQKQFDAQLAQWDKEFEYTKMSDEQKIAYNYVTAALANGQVPSDDLLARAGLTRADAELMAKQASGGGSGGNPNKEATNPYGMTDEEWAAFQRMMGYGDDTNKINGLGGNENKNKPTTPWYKAIIGNGIVNNKPNNLKEKVE